MVKKILIIRNDKIGDFVYSSCIFREIKRVYPDSKITAVVSNKNKELIEKNKKVDRIFTINHSPKNLGEIFEYYKLSRKLGKEGYDLGFELRGSFFNIFFLLFLSKVKKRIGFYNHPVSKLFLNYGYKRTLKKHISLSMLDLINSLGFKCEDNWPDIQIGEEDKREVEKFMNKNNLEKFISIVPEASDEKRQWPLERYNSLIKWLKKNYKYKILLIGTDKKKINWLKKRNPGLIPVVKKNLRLVYLLFKNSELVIAPDGGTMHLAWASKTNLIAFFPEYLTSDILPLNSKVLYGEGDSIKNIKEKEVKEKVGEILD